MRTVWAKASHGRCKRIVQAAAFIAGITVTVASFSGIGSIHSPNIKNNYSPGCAYSLHLRDIKINTRHHPMQKTRPKILLEKNAERATRWIGSTQSLVTHTIIFIVAFILPLARITTFNDMLLVLTTLVSLEAIYLAIFIQMSVNKNTADIEEIQEDVEDIQEDVEVIQEDIDEIQENVEDIQEEIEDLGDDKEEPVLPATQKEDVLTALQQTLLQLQKEIDTLKKQQAG